MSAKLRPEDLTSEEWALWDETYLHRLGRGHGPKVSAQEASEVILARRALFVQGNGEEKVRFRQCGCVLCICEDERQCHGCGAKLCEEHRKSPSPAPEVKCQNCEQGVARHREHVGFSESNSAWQFLCQPAPPAPAKVECPNCGEMTERSHSRYEGPGPDKWACQPAPPEPAAPVGEQCPGYVRRGDLAGERHRCEEKAGECPIHDKSAAPVVYVCPNCNKQTATKGEHVSSRNRDSFTCQPAPPEPAAICSPEWDKRVHSSAAKIALATAGMTTPPEPAAPSWMKVSCLGDVDAGKEDLLCPPPDPKSCWICRQHEEHCCPQPEPTAREMPEAVHEAANYLRQEARYETDPQVRLHSQKTMRAATLNAAADALEREWRNLAQPVAVGMTEELRMILDVAESRAEDQRHDGLLECSRNLERAIAAVRQQAAQGRKVELGKVRELVNDLKRALSEAAPSEMTMLDPHEWRSDLAAVFAELDDAEGKRRE